VKLEKNKLSGWQNFQIWLGRILGIVLILGLTFALIFGLRKR
jgi:hypothetical protein